MSGNGREFVFTLGGDERGLVDAARRADAALKSNTASTEGLAAAQRGAGQATESFLGALGRVGSLAAGGYVGKQIVDTFVGVSRALTEAQMNADRLMSQFSAGVGAGRVAQEFDFVRQVSNRLGLEMNATAVSYARFAAASRGTSLEGVATRQVFESVAKAAAVMGLSVDESQGVLRALEQMMSKGVVQAEELRGQLGDRLPGALQIAARAMGVTTGRLQEMAKEGELLSTDFLPRFARQLEQEVGGGADAAANRLQSAFARMGNAWEALKQNAAGSGFGEAQSRVLALLADRVQGVADNLAVVRANGEGAVGVTWALAKGLFSATSQLDLLAGGAKSLDGRLQEATARLNELQNSAERNPGDVYITKLRDSARELVDELQRARRLLDGTEGQSAAEGARLARYESAVRVREEETARRREGMSKLTSELAGETSKLAKALKTLDASYVAGDPGVETFDQYSALKRKIESEYGPKGKPSKSKDNPLLAIEDDWQRRFEAYRERNANAMDRSEEAAAAEEDRARSFMLAQVQRSDERALREAERRAETAGAAQDQFRTAALQVDASMLGSAQARGAALLAIEKAQVTARIAALKLEGVQRSEVEEAAAQYLSAREAQLTEELKPEWQRRLDAWGNTTELMRQAYDDMMTGFLERGEDVFVQWVETGKFSARSLVSYIGAEFAKLAYKRYIVPGLSSVLDAGLKWVFGGSGSGEPAGGNILDPWGNGGARAAGGGVRSGASYGVAEAEPEVFETAGGKRYLIPGSDGWITPMARAGAAGGGGGVANFVEITYNVPAGQSPAAYAAALDAHSDQMVARVAAELARPGRLLNRAARAAVD